MRSFCNKCRNETEHTVSRTDKAKGEADDIVFWDRWEIIACDGCGARSFRHISGSSDDIDPETGFAIETVSVYPDRVEGKLPIRSYFLAPETVRTIYRETIYAFNGDLNILCAVGLRAVIESVCLELDISDGPVEKTLASGNRLLEKAIYWVK